MTSNYLHYNHTHTRERSRSHSRERSPIFTTTRPHLIRRNSKRQRIDLYDDDSFDDYPHNASLSKPSRALTIREPNQLEKLNIWSPTHTTHRRHHHHDHHHHDHHHHDHHHHDHHHHNRRDSFDHEDSDTEERIRIRHIHRRSLSRGRSPSPSSRCSDEPTFHIQDSSRERDRERDRDREYRLKIKAAVSIPRRNSLSIQHTHSHHIDNHHHHHQPSSSTPTHWPGDWFRARSREKWSQEDWEARERTERTEQRRGFATNSFWPDERDVVVVEPTTPKIERRVTFRRIKRTKTDEWKPLRNLRRFD